MSKGMSLWELGNKGRELEALFFYGDIDEDTLKDSQELLISELENKSNSLVILYKKFEELVGKKSPKTEEDKGLIRKEIKRLQDYKKDCETRFENYKTRLTECMYNIGMNTGKSNGIMTDRGVLTMTKSQKEVPIDMNDVDDKYKKYEVKFDVNKEELGKLMKVFGKRLKVSEPKLDKELYKNEVGIQKEQCYSMTVK